MGALASGRIMYGLLRIDTHDPTPFCDIFRAFEIFLPNLFHWSTNFDACVVINGELTFPESNFVQFLSSCSFSVSQTQVSPEFSFTEIRKLRIVHSHIIVPTSFDLTLEIPLHPPVLNTCYDLLLPNCNYQIANIIGPLRLLESNSSAC